MAVLIFVLFIIILDITALFCGADSRDNLNGCEWERRFHYWTNVINKQNA